MAFGLKMKSWTFALLRFYNIDIINSAKERLQEAHVVRSQGSDNTSTDDGVVVFSNET